MNTLLHMSLKPIRECLRNGSLEFARQLFDRIPEPDLRAWTLFISAHTQYGFPKQALVIYSQFLARNLKPDGLLLLSAVKACAASLDLVNAKRIHDDAIRFKLSGDVLLGNALIHMYGKCKHVDGARRVFDGMMVKDVVSWTSMISCYVNCGMRRESLWVFREMMLRGVRPNEVTLSSVLPAISETTELKLGREIHGFVLRNAMERNGFVSSALVNLYASCLSLREAQLIFDDMSRPDNISWNVMLTACFSNKALKEGLDLFHRRRKEGGILDIVSWNAVISGCVQNEENALALKVLGQLQDSGLKPNHVTIISVLPACTNLESLRGGKEIHGYIFRHYWFDENITMITALVLLYAKCGDLDFSRRVFNLMPNRDTVTWNTMIIANSMHGYGKEALMLFRKMLELGVKPNSVTFTGVLSGCSHSKLVDEALLIFNSMSSKYSVEPDGDHYSCLVDVLSRAGRLNEAYDFIQKMPMKPTSSAWGALLSACRIYKNVEMAKIAASQLFEIEPDNPGNYVLLSNIFVTAKLWAEASEIRKKLRDRGIVKTPGRSWVHMNNKVYSFVAGGKRNEQHEDIYRFLDAISEKMKLAGYQPNMDFVLQDVGEAEKVETLCNHSEKLAVAFAILNSNGKSPIRVFKNLRICGDCHNAIKVMAKIFGMQIIVRDSLRFHHFENGCCSCHDFW